MAVPGSEDRDTEWWERASSTDRIEIREVGWVARYNRVWFAGAAAFVVLWCALVAAEGAWWFLLVGVLSLGGLLVLYSLQGKDSLIAEGDDLTVRNSWRTHHVKRSDIEVISVRERRGVRPGKIEVRLRDGSAIEAMVADPGGYNVVPGRSDLPDIQTRLSAWLRAEAEPDEQ